MLSLIIKKSKKIFDKIENMFNPSSTFGIECSLQNNLWKYRFLAIVCYTKFIVERRCSGDA